MLQILNRLAWLSSLAAGFLGAMFVFTMTGSFHGGGIGDDTFLPLLIFTLMIAGLVKRIFLPQKMLSQAAGSLESKRSGETELKAGNIEQSKEKAAQATSVFQDKTAGRPQPEPPFAPVSSVASEPDKQQAESAKTEEALAWLKQGGKEQEVKKTERKSLQLNFVKKFFRENALAKIGGILLFLGVLFLLQLIYTVIGPIGKLMIGFAVGFLVFGIGLLAERRGYRNEARILLGTSILINYLVILAGRYLIGEGMLVEQTLLNEGVTFFLLILNTIFAISVAMAHYSGSLLLFAFVVAYLNPFLIGETTTETPYTLLVYALVVSAGAVVLSRFYRNRSSFYSYNLLHAAFLGGNILALLAPSATVWQWSLKLSLLGLVSLVCLFQAYAKKDHKLVTVYFVGMYLFFIALVEYGSVVLGAAFSGISVVAFSLVFLGLSLVGGAVLVLFMAPGTLVYAMLMPLFILAGMFFTGIFSVGAVAAVMISAMFLYLFVFAAIFRNFTQQMIYAFFGALGLFVFLVSGFLGDILHYKLSTTAASEASLSVQAYAILASAFVFMLVAYAFSRRQGLERLYAVATLFSIIAILPVLQREGDLMLISAVSVGVFLLANIFLPLINRELILHNVKNLAFGLVAGIIFVVAEIFWFWYGDAGLSKVTLGMSFLGLAVLYFVLAYFLYNRISRLRATLPEETVSAGESRQSAGADAVYTVLGVSISLFSLAIAYVFSGHSEVVSAVWLFEATLLFFFYGRLKDIKIYAAAMVLMVIGLVKFFLLVPLVEGGVYVSLIPLAVIFLSFALNLKFMQFEKRSFRLAHDLAHIAGMLAVLVFLFNLIPEHGQGWMFLVASLFGLVLALLYSFYSSSYIKIAFAAYLAIFFLLQIAGLEGVFNYVERFEVPALKLLQPLAAVLISAAVIWFIKLSETREEKYGKFYWRLNAALAAYAFIITTQFVYYFLYENHFMITIYWGVLALVFLGYGIQRDYLKMRTVGLYIIILTTAKILLYDIWSGLDDAVMRVVALMVVGGIMIGVSMLYSKKYGSDLKGEFEIRNLLDH